MIDKKTEDIILLVFNSLGKIPGRTYLQKIFFLIENELIKEMDLNYIKYHYGPFSKDLQVCVNDLVKSRLVNENTYVTSDHETHQFTISQKGKTQAEQITRTNPTLAKKIEKFCDRFKNHSPSELLRFVYANYPSWTTNSVLNNS